MNQKELNEIRRRIAPGKNNMGRLYGCYVNYNKEIIAKFDESMGLMPEIELNSNDLLVDLARIGLGVAYIPDYCVPKNDPDLYCIPVQEEMPERKIVTAYNENTPLSAAAKRFLDLLKEDVSVPEHR